MRKALLAAGVLVLLAVVFVAVFASVRYRQGQDVRGSSTEEFVATEPEPAPVEEEQPGISWPTFRPRPDIAAAGLGTCNVRQTSEADTSAR